VILRASSMGSSPGEPEWVRIARDAYYEHRMWLEALENRLCRSDAGMAFVYRVRAIGRVSRRRAHSGR
jgi:hypothetical protein